MCLDYQLNARPVERAEGRAIASGTLREWSTSHRASLSERQETADRRAICRVAIGAAYVLAEWLVSKGAIGAAYQRTLCAECLLADLLTTSRVAPIS